VTRAARQCRASARHGCGSASRAEIADPISRLAADWLIAENHAPRSGRGEGRRESRESLTQLAQITSQIVRDSDDEGCTKEMHATECRRVNDLG